MRRSVMTAAVIGALGCGLPATGHAVALPTDEASLGMNGRGDYLLAWPDYSRRAPLVVSAGSLLAPFPAALAGTGDPGAQLPASVAVAADGTRGAAWFDQPRPSPAGDFAYAVDVAISGPGSSAWTIQQVAAPAAVDTQGPPLLTFGPQSQAILLWAVTVRSHSTLVASRRPAQGDFGPPRTLYREVSEASVGDATATFDGAGAAIVAFDRGIVGCAPVVLQRASSCRPVNTESFVVFGDAAGRFARATGIIGCEQPVLAEATTGDAAIAITCVGAGDTFSVNVAERRARGRFGRFTEVSDRRSVRDYAPSVGVAPSGAVTMAWLHQTQGRGEAVDLAAGRIGGPLSRPAGLPGAGNSQGPPQTLVDPRGRTYVVFVDQRSILRISRIRPGGAIGASRVLSPPGIVASSAQVSVSRDGRGLAVYGLASGAQATEFRVK